MPYIPKEKRALYDGAIGLLCRAVDHEEEKDRMGALNYIITRLVVFHPDKESYNLWNSRYGMLLACAAEMYRRKVAPYEDLAKERNGDVY